MRNTTPIAIIIALFIGVAAGFFIGKQKLVTPAKQQTSAQPTPDTEE
jgi:F0F1-type ATP synthase assembly protein I